MPLAVAALAAQFFFRNRNPSSDRPPRLREDIPGKTAGVLFYLLVGAVALGAWLGGGRWTARIRRAGDAVFVYTVVVFVRNLRRSG